VVAHPIRARDREHAMAGSRHPLDLRRGRRLLRPRAAAEQGVCRAAERSADRRRSHAGLRLRRARCAHSPRRHLALGPRGVHVPRRPGAHRDHAVH
jgi:hypothetical protein